MKKKQHKCDNYLCRYNSHPRVPGKYRCTLYTVGSRGLDGAIELCECRIVGERLVNIEELQERKHGIQQCPHCGSYPIWISTWEWHEDTLAEWEIDIDDALSGCVICHICGNCGEAVS